MYIYICIVSLVFIMTPQQPQFLGSPSCPKTCFTRSMGVRLLAAGGSPLWNQIPGIWAGSDFSTAIERENQTCSIKQPAPARKLWIWPNRLWIPFCSMLHSIRIFSCGCYITEAEKCQEKNRWIYIPSGLRTKGILKFLSTMWFIYWRLYRGLYYPIYCGW